VRKDYTAAGNSAEAEIDFVARYWTNVWKQHGDPSKRLKRILRGPEFRIMKPYLASLPGDARILDGGCGLGEWTVALGRRGYKTLGIDVSAETIAKLQEVFPDVSFAVADIRDAKLPSENFDAYISWGVFEHFEEGMQRCVREAYRLLRPGGLLFITVPFDNLRHSLAGALARGRETADKSGPMRFYQWRFTRAELARELSIGGFEVLELRPLHKRQGMLRWLSRTFGWNYDHFAVKAASAVIAPFVPGVLVAHMLMAVARKPEDIS